MSLNQLLFKKKQDVNIPFLGSVCPRCGHDQLLRIKRKKRHKVINALFLGSVNIKRYSCEKCEWKGLKLQNLN